MAQYSIIRSFQFNSIALLIILFSPFICYAATAPWVGQTLSGIICTGNAQGYGPFDYNERLIRPNDLKIVEGYHFNSDVQNLIKGQSGHITGDLDYTLRAWPNHHKALQVISRYHSLHTSSQDKRYARKTLSPVECYFQRAINFSPNDAITHMLYAIFLYHSNQSKKAAEQYEKALVISPDNMSIHYNYGLLLTSMKQYDKALVHAKKAYESGYPLPGLKRKLVKAGKWTEIAAPNASTQTPSE